MIAASALECLWIGQAVRQLVVVRRGIRAERAEAKRAMRCLASE